MSRRSGVWWWQGRKCWASWVNNKQKPLGKDPSPEGKKAAERELYRLLSMPTIEPEPAAPERMTVGEVMQRFNDHAKDTLEPVTMKVYERRLKSFKRAWKDLEASKVKPRHVNEWVASHSWKDSTTATAIAIVRRAFSWATKEGYIEKDPTLGFSSPTPTRRQEIPSPHVATKILEAAPTRQFRDFIEAVARTGCRPGEAAKVTAKDFDPKAGTWTIRGKTTRKTGKLRVVHLPPSVVETCKRLAVEHPSGPLYRNYRGRPWTNQAYGDAMRKIRVKLKLGPEAVAYGFRHLFCTDALERGVPIATVAELMGHTSTAMISKTYSHLASRTSHLREALAKIRPDGDLRSDTSGRKPDASGQGGS